MGQIEARTNTEAAERRRSRREANDLVAETLLPRRGTQLCRCECGRDECAKVLTVHEDEYRLARRRRGHIVAYDHVDATIDRKVSCSGEVCVVVAREASASAGY